MEIESLANQLEDLQRQVRELSAVVRGVDLTTQGWDGECLRVRKLSTIENIELGGNLIKTRIWTALNTHQNGWTNLAAQYRLEYYLTEHGTIWIRGIISPGTAAAGTIIFTLPTGYAPTAFNYILSSDSVREISVEIRTDGNVAIATAVVGAIFINHEIPLW